MLLQHRSLLHSTSLPGGTPCSDCNIPGGGIQTPNSNDSRADLNYRFQISFEHAQKYLRWPPLHWPFHRVQQTGDGKLTCSCGRRTVDAIHTTLIHSSSPSSQELTRVFRADH